MALKASEYQAYIQSDAWKEKRRKALIRSGGKCCLCGARHDLHVHHNTYDRLGDELETDLAVLCKECHKAFHRHRKIRKKKSKTVKRIAKESTISMRPDILGRELSDERYSAGLTPSRLSRLAMIHESLIWSYEAGEVACPDAKIVGMIRKAISDYRSRRGTNIKLNSNHTMQNLLLDP